MSTDADRPLGHAEIAEDYRELLKELAEDDNEAVRQFARTILDRAGESSD